MPSCLPMEGRTGLTGVSSDLTWLLRAAELTQSWLMGSVSDSLHVEGRGMASHSVEGHMSIVLTLDSSATGWPGSRDVRPTGQGQAGNLDG